MTLELAPALAEAPVAPQLCFACIHSKSYFQDHKNKLISYNKFRYKILPQELKKIVLKLDIKIDKSVYKLSKNFLPMV